MKKNSKPLNRFWIALSGLNSGQQFLLVAIFLGLLLFALWTGFTSILPQSELAESTASYDGLNPGSLGYWRERAERDIESARDIAGKSNPTRLEMLLRRNLSATIRSAAQIKNTVEKTNALASIVSTQIAQNVGTNINEAIQAMDRSRECQQIRMSLCAPLAFFYIQSGNRLQAKSAINDYFQFLRDNSIDPDDVEQRELLNRITDACVILGMSTELNAFLQELMFSANALRSEARKEQYFSLIAEQQTRLQKYSDAIATLENVKSPELLAQGFRKLIENRMRISNPDYEKTDGSLSNFSRRQRIRHPEMIAQLLERIYITIGRISNPKIQSQVFDQLFESDMMLYPELRDIIRGVLLESHAIESSVKVDALAVIDNPKSRVLREAMGMVSLEAEPNADTTPPPPKEPLLDGNPYVLSMQSVSLDRIYVEEIRILINTAIEFLNWGNRKDAIPLLNRAMEKSKGLILEKKHGVSRTAIATVLLGAGEIESAQAILADAFALLNYMQKTAQVDADLAQIAQVQIRGRLLEDAFATIREILPGSRKNELLQLLLDEWIRIGHWDEALQCVSEMPGSAAKAQQQTRVQNAAERFRKKHDENKYENSELDEIVRSETAEKSERLFQLLQSQIQENLLHDAHETANCVTDPDIRNQAMTRIVYESILCARPYFSQLPLHQNVRRDFYNMGMQAAKAIPSPQQRLSEMVNVFAQSGWNLPESSTEADVRDIIKSWDAIPDSSPEINRAKINLATRMVHARMRHDAKWSVSWVSGTKYFFETQPGSAGILPASGRQDACDPRELLLKSTQLAQTLSDAHERVECFCELSSLFYLNGEPAIGKTYHEQTLSHIEQVKDPKRKAEICLFLAQTQHLANEPDEAQKMFQLALDAANAIASTGANVKRVDRILEKRIRERTISDICRGKAEVGLLHDAIKTSDSIGEQFFVDRLCKTVGYIQLNNGDYKDAELTFKKIDNERLRTSCLNDTAFQMQWQSLDEQGQ